ncbi:MAG: SDR family NAD(P)-dependent oxidoreductase [bacterium]
MDRHFRLDGQRAVISGASRGIGAAIAVELASAGADVISVHRTKEEPPVATAVRDFGHRYDVIHYDLAAVDGIPALVNEILTRFGQVDILVHNAGIQRRRPFTEFAVEDWDAVMNVHLKAAFLLAQGLGRPMLERGRGKIIFTSSLLAYQGGLMIPAYASAKAGLANLARALANECAARGVNVNTVAPGYIDGTELAVPLKADPVRYRQITERIPAGRWGTPDEVAPAVRFLASDAARYIHGHTLVVDGGWMGR